MDPVSARDKQNPSVLALLKRIQSESQLAIKEQAKTPETREFVQELLKTLDPLFIELGEELD